MLARLLLLFPIIGSWPSILHRPKPECAFHFQKIIQLTQPLYYQPDGDSYKFVKTKFHNGLNQIVLKKNDVMYAVCEGENPVIYSCKHPPNLSEGNSEQVNLRVKQCNRRYPQTEIKTNRKCGKEEAGTVIEYGYKVNNTFLSVFEICVDPNKYHHNDDDSVYDFYVAHTVHRSQLVDSLVIDYFNNKRPLSGTFPFWATMINVSEQNVVPPLGPLIKITNRAIMLLQDFDAALIAFVKAIPKAVEIYSGTSGVAVISRELDATTAISGEVPQYIWKLMKIGKGCLFFVVHNAPNPTRNVLCSSQGSVRSEWTYDGYKWVSECCSYQEMTPILGLYPDVDCSEPMLNIATPEKYSNGI